MPKAEKDTKNTKTLIMALFSRKNIRKVKENPFGLTKDDIKGKLKGFPMGVVIRMLEEQELQENEPDVKVFQDDLYMDAYDGGFDWGRTEAGDDFWSKVVSYNDFNLFFEKYPEYERYNL